jgi:hypothetical protein
VTIPHALSVLATNTWDGEVKGINDVQAQEAATYGPGSYTPVIPVTYWTFRLMVLAGFLLAALMVWGLVLVRRGRLTGSRWFNRLAVPAVALPFLASTFGWIFTEMGRQPWVVYGLLRTANGVSPSVGTLMVVTTLAFAPQRRGRRGSGRRAARLPAPERPAQALQPGPRLLHPRVRGVSSLDGSLIGSPGTVEVAPLFQERSETRGSHVVPALICASVRGQRLVDPAVLLQQATHVARRRGIAAFIGTLVGTHGPIDVPTLTQEVAESHRPVEVSHRISPPVGGEGFVGVPELLQYAAKPDRGPGMPSFLSPPVGRGCRLLHLVLPRLVVPARVGDGHQVEGLLQKLGAVEGAGRVTSLIRSLEGRECLVQLAFLPPDLTQTVGRVRAPLLVGA